MFKNRVKQSTPPPPFNLLTFYDMECISMTGGAVV